MAGRAGQDRLDGAGLMRCDHPDWLDNRLLVTGPSEELEAFRRAAAGSGRAPWVFDYDAFEEDLFTTMLEPPPERRTISVQGAKILARQVRDIVLDDHEAEVSRVGRDVSCPFDLHSLVPVPWDILRQGWDSPRAADWLWANWGTTWHLRRVEVVPLNPDQRARLAEGEAGIEIRFWSADWSPWPALATCRAQWRRLRFEVRIEYWREVASETARAPKTKPSHPGRGRTPRKKGATAASRRTTRGRASSAQTTPP